MGRKILVGLAGTVVSAVVVFASVFICFSSAFGLGGYSPNSYFPLPVGESWEYKLVPSSFSGVMDGKTIEISFSDVTVTSPLSGVRKVTFTYQGIYDQIPFSGTVEESATYVEDGQAIKFSSATEYITLTAEGETAVISLKHDYNPSYSVIVNHENPQVGDSSTTTTTMTLTGYIQIPGYPQEDVDTQEEFSVTTEITAQESIAASAGTFDTFKGVFTSDYIGSKTKAEDSLTKSLTVSEEEGDSKSTLRKILSQVSSMITPLPLTRIQKFELLTGEEKLTLQKENRDVSDSDTNTKSWYVAKGIGPVRMKYALDIDFYESGTQSIVDLKSTTLQGLTVKIKGSTPHSLWRLGERLDFEAVVSDNTGEVGYKWDLDGDGERDDAFDEKCSETYYIPKTFIVSVEVQDEITTTVAYLYVTIEKLKIPGEPSTCRVIDLIPGKAVNPSKTEELFNFEESKKQTGLIIIIHGLGNSASNAWLGEMATAIEDRLNIVDTVPNICLYDWGEMANPDEFFRREKKLDLQDFYDIRALGIAQGIILSDWISNQISSGNIDPSATTHIIGHSAGGFVAGTCAGKLKSSIRQITLLDTPLPNWNIRGEYLPAGGKVDAYYTQWGTFPTWWQEDYPTQTHWANASLDEDCPSDNTAHSWVHDWYTNKTIDPNGPKQEQGFYYSPWIWGIENPFPEDKSMTMAEVLRMAEPSLSEPKYKSTSVGEFSTFGDVSVTDGVYTITEGEGNAGIYKTIDFPEDVESVTFRYRFTTAGDGDFLSVHMGEDALLYIGPDLQISRDNYIDGEAEITDMAGTSSQLIFKLISRGDANAVLSIDSITLVTETEEEEETTTTSGDSGGGGGCFIATVAFGTPMAEQVKSLCKFRDQILLRSPAGRRFVGLYYTISPSIADFIRNKPGLKAMVREALKPLVEISKEITK